MVKLKKPNDKPAVKIRAAVVRALIESALRELDDLEVEYVSQGVFPLENIGTVRQRLNQALEGLERRNEKAHRAKHAKHIK